MSDTAPRVAASLSCHQSTADESLQVGRMSRNKGIYLFLYSHHINCFSNIQKSYFILKKRRILRTSFFPFGNVIKY